MRRRSIAQCLCMKLAYTNLRLFNEPQIYLAIAFAVAMIGFWPSFFSKLASTDIAHMGCTRPPSNAGRICTPRRIWRGIDCQHRRQPLDCT